MKKIELTSEALITILKEKISFDELRSKDKNYSLLTFYKKNPEGIDQFLGRIGFGDEMDLRLFDDGMSDFQIFHSGNFNTPSTGLKCNGLIIHSPTGGKSKLFELVPSEGDSYLNIANTALFLDWGRENIYLWKDGAIFTASTGAYELTVHGDIFANSIVTNTSSDSRLKEIVETPDYMKRITELGDVCDFVYNETAQEVYKDFVDEKTHTGLIFQEVKDSWAGELISSTDKKSGYGRINYNSPDLLCTAIGALQQMIRRVEELEKELKDKQ